MKSILFIIPWSGFYIGRSGCSFAEEPERPPEGVVGLATFLKSKGAPVKVADMQQMLRSNDGDAQQTYADLWQLCTEFKPDCIGMSFFTARFEYARDVFVYLTRKYNESTLCRPFIFAGGVHPTLLPHTTYRHIPFDALVIGEGELPLLQFLSGVSPHEIKGFFMPGDTEAVKADVIDNLDDLPFPDWSLIDIDFYTQPSFQISYAEKDSVMPITFGRGCMYRCNFCAHNCFLYARCHSADYFIRKMQHVAKQCGVSYFIIQDSSIGNFRTTWKQVCHRLIEMGSPYKWWANLRANQVDEDFLRLLKAAGCIKLFFGFESGSQRVLNRMNKRITIDQCRRAAELCHKLDLPFYTSYIVNYFDEEESDLRLTEELIRETRPTSLAVNKFSPIPGSIDYDTNEERITPYIKTIHDWTMLGMLVSPRLFGNMPEEDFERWYKHLRGLKKYINSHEDTSQ